MVKTRSSRTLELGNFLSLPLAPAPSSLVLLALLTFRPRLPSFLVLPLVISFLLFPNLPLVLFSSSLSSPLPFPSFLISRFFFVFPRFSVLFLLSSSPTLSFSVYSPVLSRRLSLPLSSASFFHFSSDCVDGRTPCLPYPAR